MTLGSNVLATGIDVAFGDISNQWKPNKYMNKEGATNIRGTNNFVAFGPDIIDANKKDADNGKANPIKAHTVGSYTFIDEKLSPKQYDILTSGKKPVYTVEANTKVTEKTATSLEAEAIKTGVFMKADTIDSYLATIEANGNLESYGYETKGKISAQNDGNATSLYVTLKDSGETIKIDIGETNSSDERISSLKGLTNVAYTIPKKEEQTQTDNTKQKKDKKDKKQKDKKADNATAQASPQTDSQEQTPQQDSQKAEAITSRQEGSSTTWRNAEQTTDEPIPDWLVSKPKEKTTQESEPAKNIQPLTLKLRKSSLKSTKLKLLKRQRFLIAMGTSLLTLVLVHISH